MCFDFALQLFSQTTAMAYGKNWRKHTRRRVLHCKTCAAAAEVVTITLTGDITLGRQARSSFIADLIQGNLFTERHYQ